MQPNNGEAGIKVIGDGAVELYYDNSVKLTTTGAGVDINGNLNLDDNEYALFGSSNDLQIHHDGSHSYIHQDGIGTLYILADNFRVNNEANSENIITADANGSVGLYYDNDKKFETKSYGSLWTGQLAGLDNAKVTFGNGDDLQIYHDGSNSFIDSVLAGSQLLIRTKESGGTTNNAAKFMPTGAVELYYDGSKKFETTSDGATGYWRSYGSWICGGYRW